MRIFTLFPVLFVCVCAQAAVTTEQVAYTAQGVTMRGTLAYDDSSKTARPGVLVVHEWWGVGDHAIESAKKLAALGYVALAVDMYGGGKTTTEFQEAAAWSGQVKGDLGLMRARFEAAIAALKESGRFDGEHLGAIGFCFGGTVVLEMARAGVDLDGVVSFHGGLKSAQEPPREIKARVLVCHGADDPYVPADEVAAFEEEMRAAKADWQFNSYGNAVHSFTNPAANSDGARYDEKAATRSWGDMTEFFLQVFGK